MKSKYYQQFRIVIVINCNLFSIYFIENKKMRFIHGCINQLYLQHMVLQHLITVSMRLINYTFGSDAFLFRLRTTLVNDSVVVVPSPKLAGSTLLSSTRRALFGL